MGRSNSGKSTVEKALEQMGFKRSISYTTREPRVRNGVMEKDGDNYRFVSKGKFMSLVDSDKMIEYTEYDGNLYGTPRPYGSKRYVAVVELNGYKKLKEIYGEQVTGFYLKCDEDIAIERASKRDGSEEFVHNRHKSDEVMLEEMEKLADIVIDSNQDRNKMIADILKYLREGE